MMAMTNLAIIIPYYKLTFFRETLESLAAQTNQRFHVYIGNDASPEDPRELLKEFEGKFNFIYKKFEENLGDRSLTKQWDRCIAMMQGEEWFMILGDDDLLSENVIIDFHKNINSIAKESKVVRFASRIINGKGQNMSGVFLQPKKEDAIASYCRKLQGLTRSSLSEYIFRKTSYDKFGFKDYCLAWSSDDRAVIDFSDGLPIYSLNAVVFIRNSDLNISGGSVKLVEKIKAKLQSTKELIKDYRSSLTAEQNIILLGLFEQQFYLQEKTGFKDCLFLFSESLKVKGLKYFLNQIKAYFYKFIFGFKIK